jgi:hypothetical protein
MPVRCDGGKSGKNMPTRFKLSIALAAVAALGVAIAQPARAAFVNGGFEQAPDFFGYTPPIGNASIQDNNFKATPDGSLQQALFSTNTQPIPGQFGATTNIGALDAYFNLGAGTLEAQDVKSGSGVKQTFTASAGDKIQFYYDFATNEGANSPNQDFGFITLQGPGLLPAVQTNLAKASDATTGTDPLEGINSLFNTQTGYKLETGAQSFTLNITADGTYTLAFGVANVHDTVANSGLLIDDISGVTGPSVPLPSTAWAGIALFAGLGSMQLIRRRRTIAV